MKRLAYPKQPIGSRPEEISWVRVPGTETVRESGKFPEFNEFRMGVTQRSHPIEISDFYIAKFPTTNKQYYAKNNVLDPYLPVVNISWYEAEDFCNMVSKKMKLPRGAIRLPTDAEWEWVARGPKGMRYPWGDVWESFRCNCLEWNRGKPSPVDCFPGGAADWWCSIWSESDVVYDLAGNVWEWTASEYTSDYQSSDRSIMNMNVSGSRGRMVFRGGSWWGGAETMFCGARSSALPLQKFDNLGFRLAKNAV